MGGELSLRHHHNTHNQAHYFEMTLWLSDSWASVVHPWRMFSGSLPTHILVGQELDPARSRADADASGAACDSNTCPFSGGATLFRCRRFGGATHAQSLRIDDRQARALSGGLRLRGRSRSVCRLPCTLRAHESEHRRGPLTGARRVRLPVTGQPARTNPSRSRPSPF